MFDHFRMELTGIFSSAQRRKANEGVRIAHLDPNTRMNSKDEYRQGTNIMMQPVRGVGVWLQAGQAASGTPGGHNHHGQPDEGRGRHLHSLVHQGGGVLDPGRHHQGQGGVFTRQGGAMRTMEERDVLGGIWVAPEGLNFFPSRISMCVLLSQISLSLSRVKVKFGLALFCFVQ